MRLKPTSFSFLSKYLLSLTPVYVVVFSEYVSHEISYPPHALILVLSVILLTTGWVLRSREASWALGLFLTLITVITVRELHGISLSIESIPQIVSRLERIHYNFMELSLVASLPVLLYTEAYRRSISYEIGENSLRIEGGLVRRQLHDIPYDKIGRIILERGLLARIFRYGTIIPVGLASWGEEYYTRMVGVRGGKDGVGVGVGYARTLQEISRDPLKVLYGIPHSIEVYNELEKKISFMYEAEKRKISLLESINTKLDK